MDSVKAGTLYETGMAVKIAKRNLPATKDQNPEMNRIATEGECRFLRRKEFNSIVSDTLAILFITTEENNSKNRTFGSRSGLLNEGVVRNNPKRKRKHTAKK